MDGDKCAVCDTELKEYPFAVCPKCRTIRTFTTRGTALWIKPNGVTLTTSEVGSAAKNKAKNNSDSG